ncbi:MAG TPA: nucleotide sugar dehydrogenase, partial [Thermoanaerobaculia bacterium]|nr:nucleotide sugar dehydrogenase [Thermoanaerobaculia bacterium]
MPGPSSVYAAQLRSRLLDGSALIGVIGLGYVGLPLSLTVAEHGYRVLGFDLDPEKIAALAAGRSYIRHLDPGRLAPLLESGRFAATGDFDRLAEPDVLLICVPTPLTGQREPDLSYVQSTSEEIRDRLRPGQLVVLESTTYPGTTSLLIRPTLEASGLRCGIDFLLAYSPEREDPGNPRFATSEIPKVVGGVGPESTELAELFYRRAVGEAVRVSSAEVAEASKLTENIFRAVNIALVNELKILYEKMGIDVWEVLDAAATKPFGFMRFDPGPGWGGHCIPIDPFYLTWRAREFGATSHFIELAGEVNVQMPAYVVQRLAEGLNQHQKAVRGSRILLLGLAYKRDVDDPRESPAFEIIDRLLALGAEVRYHDPFIPVAPKMRSWSHLPPLRSVGLDKAEIGGADAVVVVTDHRAVDYDLVLAEAQLIVDTRGVYRQPHPKVIKA